MLLNGPLLLSRSQLEAHSSDELPTGVLGNVHESTLLVGLWAVHLGSRGHSCAIGETEIGHVEGTVCAIVTVATPSRSSSRSAPTMSVVAGSPVAVQRRLVDASGSDGGPATAARRR